MPEPITITAVGDMPRTWHSDQYGDFEIWPVEYTAPGSKGEAERKVKAGSPAPSVGEVFDGDVVQKPGFKAELKKAKVAFNGSGGGKSGYTPAKEAEIRRLACQKSAVALLVAEVEMGKEKTGTVSELLKARIDWLEQDCIDAGKRAS